MIGTEKPVMDYSTKEELYLGLMQRFLHSEMDGESFCRDFMQLWRNDWREIDVIKNSWSERYDLQLIEACNKGKISPEEFSRNWAELWGYAGHEPLVEMLNKVFTACDCFEPLVRGEFEIDETQLKKEVAWNIENYAAAKSK